MVSDNELVRMLIDAGMLDTYRRAKHPEDLVIVLDVIAGKVAALERKIDNLKCKCGSK